MIPLQGVGGWATELWTPSQNHCVAPPKETPSVGLVLASLLLGPPGAGGGGKLKETESRAARTTAAPAQVVLVWW